MARLRILRKGDSGQSLNRPNPVEVNQLVLKYLCIEKTCLVMAAKNDFFPPIEISRAKTHTIQCNLHQHSTLSMSCM